MSNKAPGGPLAVAAAAFEEELARYSELANELRTNPISTQKSLARAPGRAHGDERLRVDLVLRVLPAAPEPPEQQRRADEHRGSGDHGPRRGGHVHFSGGAASGRDARQVDAGGAAG